MIRPGTIDLAGDRWTPFDTKLRLKGIDLTNAVMEAHIRLTADASGAALIDLDTVTVANSQGLRLVSVATVDGVKISTVHMRINETTIEGLPAALEPGDDLELAWDLLIAPSAALNPDLPAVKQRYLRGKFTVEAGATQ
jgi:hypothetical protein